MFQKDIYHINRIGLCADTDDELDIILLISKVNDIMTDQRPLSFKCGDVSEVESLMMNTPPHPFAVPFPVSSSTYTKQGQASSTPLQTPHVLGSQLQKVLASSRSSDTLHHSSTSSIDFISESFPWTR